LQLFEFGDKYRGKYDESIGVAKGYYSSVSGYMDELLWAALWLYKATDKDDYLRYILEKAHLFGGITWAMTEFSWDVKYVGVQLIASKVNPLSLSLSLSLSLALSLSLSHIHNFDTDMYTTKAPIQCF
jgi:hypothetical protein